MWADRASCSRDRCIRMRPSKWEYGHCMRAHRAHIVKERWECREDETRSRRRRPLSLSICGAAQCGRSDEATAKSDDARQAHRGRIFLSGHPTLPRMLPRRGLSYPITGCWMMPDTLRDKAMCAFTKHDLRRIMSVLHISSYSTIRNNNPEVPGSGPGVRNPSCHRSHLLLGP
jgi:hypothetical protein